MLRTAVCLFLVCCGSALAADLAGDYAGTYSGSDGADGKVQLSLKKNADATWGCIFSFSTESGDVTAKTVSCAVTDNKLTAEYEADMDGTVIHVTTEGTATENKLDGTFTAKSSSGEPMGQGKWTVSRKT